MHKSANKQIEEALRKYATNMTAELNVQGATTAHINIHLFMPYSEMNDKAIVIMKKNVERFEDIKSMIRDVVEKTFTDAAEFFQEEYRKEVEEYLKDFDINITLKGGK